MSTIRVDVNHMAEFTPSDRLLRQVTRSLRIPRPGRGMVSEKCELSVINYLLLVPGINCIAFIEIFMAR